MDVKLATLIKSLNIMDVIFSGFTVLLQNYHTPWEEEILVKDVPLIS